MPTKRTPPAPAATADPAPADASVQVEFIRAIRCRGKDCVAGDTMPVPPSTRAKLVKREAIKA